MIKALNPNKTKIIFCPFDMEEPRAQFEIVETLTIEQRAEIKSKLRGEDEDETMFKKKMFSHLIDRNKAIVREGVKSWKNIFSEEKEIESGNFLALIDALSLTPAMKEYETALDWLADVIWKNSTISENERKN